MPVRDTIAATQARCAALVAKICGGSTPPQTPVPVQKGTPMPPSFAQLVALNRDLGMNADSAFLQAAQQNPEAYQAYCRGYRDTPVQKLLDPLPQHVVTTHPPGVAKSADGTTLKSWEEQVQHWRAHPGTYDRYRAHFACQR